MTVLESIQKSSEFLARKGVDSPRLQAELLLAHVLQKPRMRLYLEFEAALTSAQADEYRELVKRRGQREPLQHILGSTSFCGLELIVNRHVLVPRPETELLAEHGWTCLKRISTEGLTPDAVATPLALDFGTGSGCIAIALAKNSPARIVALDCSAEALLVARENAARQGVSDRIEFVLGNGFAALPLRSRFDLIISNPPYIPSAEIQLLQPEVRDYDPQQALDGGADGMNYYRLFANEAGQWLSGRGRLMVEFGDGKGPSIRELLQQQKWIVESVTDDYTQRPRIITARRS